MPNFEIENIQPLAYKDMWKADVILKHGETIGEASVGQVGRITVRFQAPDTPSMDEVVEAAVRKAEESLSVYAEILRGRTGPDLLTEYRAKTLKSYLNPFPDPDDDA